jgi:hypothetical protein
MRQHTGASQGASAQPLGPTSPQDLGQIFSNHSVLAGAPLRNRTVDLLLTMQADTVWRGRIWSDYRSLEGYWRLGESNCVGQYLEPLSLD